jgi:hypothetical protein
MYRLILCLIFKLISLDKNRKICYVCEAHPAWLQVLKQKDLPNWTRPLEGKTMNISQFLDQAVASLEKVEWKKIGIKIVEIWDLFFKIVVITMILTYIGGKALGTWVHQTNDRLAANWVRLIVLQTPVMEEEKNEEDEAPLPATPSPTPLSIQDPWESPIEVELMLPLALEPLAILFTTPLMLAAAQAPVALLAAGQPVAQQDPAPATNRRRRGRRA